jgi:2-polyprenyl-3-methyl-5-hydroxy-6-metoxy-1,4-benzoquinol methylase
MKTAIHRQDEGRAYKAIPIHAASNVHEESLDMLQQYVGVGQKVLDLGAGSGAFSLRLHDSGYMPVATELDVSDWKVAEVDVIELDLNTWFSESQLLKNSTFDAVTAIEVIEHLENPSAFMREAKKLLKPHGVLLISTPNVVDLASRLKFVRQGEMRFFTKNLVVNGGHISILPYWLIEELLEKLGFKVIERRFIGINNPNPKHAWKKTAVNFLHKFLSPSEGGIPVEAAYPTCVAYVCRPAIDKHNF